MEWEHRVKNFQIRLTALSAEVTKLQYRGEPEGGSRDAHDTPTVEEEEAEGGSGCEARQDKRV